MNTFAEPIHDASMPLSVAVDLQDHLLSATNDLERLQTLLDDSHQALQAGFFDTLLLLQGLHEAGRIDAAPMAQATRNLSGAVKALQFQDMATQLIAHTRHRLHNCADRLARDAFADDGDEAAPIDDAPLRPNPVTQSEMDTGFIELF